MSAAAVACALAAGATFVLARHAPRVGFVDSGSDAPLRKPQSRPVPAVGGTAIALALCATCALYPDALATLANGWTQAALAAAFAVGLADDLAPRGLSPLQKLFGQIVAGVLLAVPAAGAAWSSAAWVVLGAVTAQNAFNTFDNADGAAAALAACGLVAGAPVLAAAVAGFLPFNLWIGQPTHRAHAWTPRAYLGDSGSHLLGLALFASPLGAAALWLPLLDLARVAVLRLARGVPPWVGDRRHLAHRLQAAGLPRTAVVGVLVAIASPPIVAAALGGDRAMLGLGCALSAGAFVVAVRVTPASS